MNINNNHATYSTVEELASSLKTDIDKGLDWQEAQARLIVNGQNEFKSDESSRFISRYLEQFKNPLIQLLLVSVVISLFMGQYDDAISIISAIVIVVTVAFIQEYRSEKSLKELNKLVPPSCKAIRNGRHEEFLAKFLVPGDIVVISTGDRVPADLRLVESQDLTIDESNLTGETEPVIKNASVSMKSSYLNNNNFPTLNGDINSNYSEDKQVKTNSDIDTDQAHNSGHDNLAFMGTLVQSGHGKGIVVGTGDRTQFGLVFKMMQSEEAPKSPLQVNMDELGKHLSVYSLCIIGVIVIIGWIQSRPIVEMFTIGVSLAVAAIPEGLPIVVTVTLALGVMRMARRKAVVKHLPAVETLGCVHVICTDKTGTLTKNEMSVTRLCTSEMYQANVSGVGYDEMGEVILQDLSQDQSSQMASIKRLVSSACLCNNARFDSSAKLIGQATEGAILVVARKLGLQQDLRDDYKRIDEISFSSEHKYMAVRCVKLDTYNTGNPLGGDNNSQFYVKGAIEVILSKCNYYSKLGSQLELNESYREDIRRQSDAIESRGLRVLAVASGSSLESLVFLGFLGIYDAPRPGVKEAIEVMHDSGIQVKMVTGDSKLTAESIGRMLGLLGSHCISLSGLELDNLMADSQLSETAKAERLEHVSVFYRVTPQHKVTIVKMLQTLGYITSMTGDGVNDGVALKKANIGISMGSGTDVCKEAADVILMDDNLATIVVALEEGKGIYHNIRNFIKFQLSTSIAALSLIALSTIFHIPNPLNAMQILYINILMDGPPAQSLGVESVDLDVLKQPPRNVKESVLTKDLLVNILISATIIVAGTMMVFVSEVGLVCCHVIP